MMFMIERFIASAMSLVRIAPDAPTSAPAMMRTGLPMTKPAIAAAVPVNELSRLMTTGMSAPPIGRTIVTPKIRPARTTTPRSASVVVLPRVRRAGAPRISATVPAHGDDREHDRDELAARDVDRLAGDEALELAAGDERTGERDRADERAEDDEDRRVEGCRPRVVEPDEVLDGDQRRRAAADRVEQRHQLRHRGHLHGRGPCTGRRRHRWRSRRR